MGLLTYTLTSVGSHSLAGPQWELGMKRATDLSMVCVLLMVHWTVNSLSSKTEPYPSLDSGTAAVFGA